MVGVAVLAGVLEVTDRPSDSEPTEGTCRECGRMTLSTALGTAVSCYIDAQRERDALRADVVRRERAAAKRALEDAARDYERDKPHGGRYPEAPAIRWLRERAAAL